MQSRSFLAARHGALPRRQEAEPAVAKATIGFEGLSAAAGTPAKSPTRMFGPRGNPQAHDLPGVMGRLQDATGIRIEVESA